MEKWYIYFNIALIVGLVYLLLKILPLEKSDIAKIDRHYQRIKHNAECLRYLQTVNAVPTWRYALLYATLFTAIELALYIVGGGTLEKPIHFLMFWVLFLLNTLFLYKMVANRSWHYMCSDGCAEDFDCMGTVRSDAPGSAGLRSP